MKVTYIALLRGINVGGKNIIKMEMLKQLFLDMSFCDVKTYIQSGNVIFRTQHADTLKLAKKIEEQLLKAFSAEIKTVVLTAAEWRDIVENAPESFGSEPLKFRYDVWFLLPEFSANECTSTIRLREGVDFLQAGKNVIYTSRLSNEINKSYLKKVNQLPIYKNVTIRNWNTTTKLCELTK